MGILYLPYGMSKSGYLLGSIFLILGGILTYFGYKRLI